MRGFAGMILGCGGLVGGLKEGVVAGGERDPNEERGEEGPDDPAGGGGPAGKDTRTGGPGEERGGEMGCGSCGEVDLMGVEGPDVRDGL